MAFFSVPKLHGGLLRHVAPSLPGGFWRRHGAGSRRASSVLQAVAAGMMLLAGTAIGAEPETYALDPVHTRVMLAVDHAGFSKAIGTVSGSTGTLRFDPDDWTTATLRAEVPLARIDFGDAKWNKAVLGNNLLDADDHPLATFVSTRIEPVDAQHAAVYGDLTLRGVTREVKLDVTLNAHKRNPLPPFRRTVGFSATTGLSRADFGIDAWKSVIGDRIELRIEAEATRARAGDDTGTPTPEQPAPGQPVPDQPVLEPPAPEEPAPDQPPPETAPEPAVEATGEPPTDPAEAPVEDPATGSTPPDPSPATDPTP
jgi:polyisoprenoid-binding protein YceI